MQSEFFFWNSEVGRRSVGISTFWFQAVCRNHIVWDATEVVEFSRKHTANVHEALSAIQQALEQLVEKRDQRRDGFARVIQKAMRTRLGADAEEVQKVLAKSGINRALAKQALETARQQGQFTIFALVDALTRLSGEICNAGERLEAYQDRSPDAIASRRRFGFHSALSPSQPTGRFLVSASVLHRRPLALRPPFRNSESYRCLYFPEPRRRGGGAMKSIASWNDLAGYGVVPITGEACGLMYRLLCDVTEHGRRIIEKALGVRSLDLPETGTSTR